MREQDIYIIYSRKTLFIVFLCLLLALSPVNVGFVE